MLIKSGYIRWSIYANIHSNTLGNYTKGVFVTNEMYLMAGESLSKSDYQKSVKSKMTANDSRRRKLLTN